MHFFWFLVVLVLFNITTAGISFNSGMCQTASHLFIRWLHFLLCPTLPHTKRTPQLASLGCLHKYKTTHTHPTAMIAPSFGAGVLLSSLMLLLFFAFDPLMVQGQTLPAWVAWFRYISPFFLSFEVLMVNELLGQHCTFAPTSASGIFTFTPKKHSL